MSILVKLNLTCCYHSLEYYCYNVKTKIACPICKDSTDSCIHVIYSVFLLTLKPGFIDKQKAQRGVDMSRIWMKIRYNTGEYV